MSLVCPTKERYLTTSLQLINMSKVEAKVKDNDTVLMRNLKQMKCTKSKSLKSLQFD